MNNYYDDYKQIIIDRFVDDCSSLVVKYHGSEIERAYDTGHGIKIKYLAEEDQILTGWDEIINYISNCQVNDIWED